MRDCNSILEVHKLNAIPLKSRNVHKQFLAFRNNLDCSETCHHNCTSAFSLAFPSNKMSRCYDHIHFDNKWVAPLCVTLQLVIKRIPGLSKQYISSDEFCHKFIQYILSG